METDDILTRFDRAAWVATRRVSSDLMSERPLRLVVHPATFALIFNSATRGLEHLIRVNTQWHWRGVPIEQDVSVQEGTVLARIVLEQVEGI